MAIRLTLVLSGRTIDRHEFAEDVGRIRIGRNADCEVQIDNLGVSRYHAEITSENGVYQLRDLRSNNGTFVNGTRVETHNLNVGDTISLGKFLLRFEPDQVDAGPAPGQVPHADQGHLTLQMDPASLAKRYREQLSRSRGYLVLSGGEERLLERAVFTFGKDEQADLRLRGLFCPRLAAVLFKDDTSFRLLDVSPRGNAVTVNGLRKRETVLNDADKLIVRGERVVFRRGTPVGGDQRATSRI